MIKAFVQYFFQDYVDKNLTKDEAVYLDLIIREYIEDLGDKGCVYSELSDILCYEKYGKIYKKYDEENMIK